MAASEPEGGEEAAEAAEAAAAAGSGEVCPRPVVAEAAEAPPAAGLGEVCPRIVVEEALEAAVAASSGAACLCPQPVVAEAAEAEATAALEEVGADEAGGRFSDDGGGAGWHTFREADSGESTASSDDNPPAPLEDTCHPASRGFELVDDEPIWSLPESLAGLDEAQSLELLLDNAEIAHEFRIGNPKVQQQCLTPGVVLELVRYITIEQPDLEEDAARRRPFVAAELLSSERVLDVMLQADASDAAAPAVLLWRFLDTRPGPEVAHVFAGYFGAVAAALFLRSQAYTAEVLRARGPAAVVASFSRWLEMRSCSELLALLICTDGPVQRLLPLQALLEALVALLCQQRGPRAATGAACESAAFLLDALMARALAGGAGRAAAHCDELLSALTSGPVLASLVETLVDPGAAGTAAAAAAGMALASLLEQLYALPVHVLLPSRSLEHRACAQEGPAEPMRPPPPPPTSFEGEGGDEVVVDSAALGELLDSAGGGAEGRLEACGTAVVQELCSNLDALCGLLPGQASGGGSSSSSSSSSGGPVPGGGGGGSGEVASGAEVDEALRLILRLGPSFAEVLAPARLMRLAALARQSAELRVLLESRGAWAALLAAAAEAAQLPDAAQAEECLAEALRERCDLPALSAAVPELVAELRASAQRRRAASRDPAGVVRGRDGCANAPTALEALRVLVALAQTRRRDVFDAFLRAGVLQRCVGSLLACRWSSLLHNALAAVVLEIARAGDLGCPLLLALLHDHVLMGHAVQVYGAGVERGRRVSEAAITSASVGSEAADGGAGAGAGAAPAADAAGAVPAGADGGAGPGAAPADAAGAAAAAAAASPPRCPSMVAAAGQHREVGFLGPLHCICAELHSLGAAEPEVAEALEAIEGWSDIVAAEVAAMESLTAKPLGGPAPSDSNSSPGGTTFDFDCLAAARLTMGRELCEEVDLSLEDLRDVNEELDLSELADMADIHRRRREKAAARQGRDPEALSLDGDDEEDGDEGGEEQLVLRGELLARRRGGGSPQPKPPADFEDGAAISLLPPPPSRPPPWPEPPPAAAAAAAAAADEAAPPPAASAAVEA